MTLYRWSQTASSDATADPTINWAEGQAPSSVNDSARAMMAATAKYRDDIAGAILTSGTSTAYTVSSYQAFDTLAHLNGQVIAFTPHATNGTTVTLNVDSLGARPLRSAPNVDLLAGTILQGTPYAAVYNNTDGAFYLQGFYGDPYNIPLAAGLDYWGSTTPNSCFAFPTGQAISRTTYAALFAIMGTTFGSGDGSTTFNLPDKTGRVSAMMEAAATRLTPSYFGGNSASIGAVGGRESHTLTIGEMPSHNHTATDGGHTHNVANAISVNLIGAGGGIALSYLTPAGQPGSAYSSQTNGGNANISVGNQGAGSPHSIVQPTIICNYIIRIV